LNDIDTASSIIDTANPIIHEHENPMSQIPVTPPPHRSTALFPRLAWAGFAILALAAFIDPADALPATGVAVLAMAPPAEPAACILGDGYKIPSGGHLTTYPVGCPSDCFDYPNGGLDDTLYCNDGVLGRSDPALTGGSVAPLVTAAHYNGYSRCSALPHPNGEWGQSADRKTCVAQ